MHDLVDVPPVHPEHGEVAQNGSAAAQGQRLGKGFLGEIRAAQLEVAGPSLLGQAGAVEAEPAPVAGVSAVEALHFPGFIQSPPARVEIAHGRVRLRLDGRGPVTGGKSVVAPPGNAESCREQRLGSV